MVDAINQVDRAKSKDSGAVFVTAPARIMREPSAEIDVMGVVSFPDTSIPISQFTAYGY